MPGGGMWKAPSLDLPPPGRKRSENRLTGQGHNALRPLHWTITVPFIVAWMVQK